MPKQKRSESQYLADFLNNCEVETRISHIVLKANMSYYRTLEIGNSLTAMGCVTMKRVSHNGDRGMPEGYVIQITSLGREALRKLAEANDIILECRTHMST